MMRFQAAISSVLAAALVPAAFFGQESIDSLEKALAQTVRALEVLGGVQQSVESNDPVTIGYIRAVTEDPILDGRLRDERLVDLRNQVNLLQTELDVLETPAFLPVTPDPLFAIDQPLGDAALPSITKGLSSKTLEALAMPKAREDVQAESTDLLGGAKSAAVGSEGLGYSADPVAHARACYYARRYEQCVTLVTDRTDDAEALFWKGRALEKLNRLDEAVKAMKRSAELSADTPEGRRAQAEVEFMEWRLSFLKDAPHLKNRGGSK